MKRGYSLTVPTVGTVSVFVYHLCLNFACGSAGSTGNVAHWWAERGLAGLIFTWQDVVMRDRFALEESIAELLRQLAPTPADRLREAQDVDAETA